ncbi:MAG: SGNH/GDSL hydrolase family protein [Bacteroidota bacterium]
MKIFPSLFIISLIMLFSCEETQQPITEEAPISYTYLALGDSYTIGESVDASLRWPVQLADSLNSLGFQVEDPLIIATTGWTTGELQQGIATTNIQDTFNLVSLLIGVNNQFRGYDTAQYRLEFQELLSQSVEFAGGEEDHVFVVSIPDYGVTPFGKNRNPEKIAIELDLYNDMARGICEARGIDFYNITDISRKGLDDPELVASDGLHPSGKMYSQWVQRILLLVKEKLQ